MNTTTTEKEQALIDAIVESEYHGVSKNDVEEFCRDAVWTGSVGDDYEARGFRRDGMGGVMNALINKGLASSQDPRRDDGTCAITADGLADYNSRH